MLNNVESLKAFGADCLQDKMCQQHFFLFDFTLWKYTGCTEGRILANYIFSHSGLVKSVQSDSKSTHFLKPLNLFFPSKANCTIFVFNPKGNHGVRRHSLQLIHRPKVILD